MLNSNSLVKTLIIALVSLVIAGWYVFSNESARVYPDISEVERKIQATEQDIATLQTQDELPALTATWKQAEMIAIHSGVEMFELDSSEASHITPEELPGGTPWYGKLVGTTKNVAIAAKRLQSHFPILFGQGEFGENKVALSFALLGTKDNF